MASKINDLPVTTPGNESAPGVSADVPLPPNWKENLDDTVVSLVPYKLFPIDVNTLEYETVTELLQPFKIKTAEQIVNPMLWSRFVNTRKDLLLSKKTDDLALVSKLLLNDNKLIMQQAYIALNYDRHEQIVACPYSDNIALLFHCTNNPQNVEKILLEGLDERVGNGGNMGRGIYFAADPRKSATYDGCRGTMFIFMVLLGDCLSVNVNQIGARVKEPDKTQVQRRSVTDLHFDSIVGQPNRFYEYVIYNRYTALLAIFILILGKETFSLLIDTNAVRYTKSVMIRPRLRMHPCQHSIQTQKVKHHRSAGNHMTLPKYQCQYDPLTVMIGHYLRSQFSLKWEFNKLKKRTKLWILCYLLRVKNPSKTN